MFGEMGILHVGNTSFLDHEYTLNTLNTLNILLCLSYTISL